MRVLVVEDEPRMASYLEKCLVAEGFDVEVAHDGETALARALAGGYAAITLDVMLPGMSGYTVCRELRAAGDDVPILMLTAKDGEYDEADALDIGADDFLRKPFSAVVLAARLRALMRRGAARSGGMAFSDLVLDVQAKAVSRGGERIELTPREFALMEYLVYNANVTLSKERIAGQVWGPGFAGSANVVEVYIGYLRKKLDAVPGSARIQTVRGQGYRLVGE